MKMPEVREKAKAFDLKTSRKSKEQIIREIQSAEGNDVCFNTGRSMICGQDACAWRGDCE